MPRRNEFPVTARSLNEGLREKSRQRRSHVSQPNLAAGRLRNDLVPNLVLVDRALATLTTPTRNVRRREAAQTQRVAASIRELGFCHLVLIDQEGQILDGLTRVEAAKLLGLAAVPCIVVDHLTPDELRVLRLALNRLQEHGTWDLVELKLELEDLALDDDMLEITGFTACEIDQILLDAEPRSVEIGPLAPASSTRSDVRLGDVFTLGRHRLVCGDARDPQTLVSLMESEQARLILTDEPYNVPIQGHVTRGQHREFAMASGEMSEAGFLDFNTAWMKGALRYLVDGGVFGTFIDWRGLGIVQEAARRLALTQINLIVWAKTNPGMGSLYRSQHELLPLFKKGQAPHTNNVRLGRNGRSRSNLWTYPGASSLGSSARRGLQDHPTVKPAAMLADAILDLTARDEVVLDPFLGSGSTLIAADQVGRRCFGVEIDPAYVAVILQRYVAAGGSAPVREGNFLDDAADVPQPALNAI
ncbi:site-specific DNA-methyltransferase [Methylobacterium sp. A54F]